MSTPLANQCTIQANLAVDHLFVDFILGGYNASHKVIKLFWHILHHDFSQQQLRQLLLFWTGASAPPYEGPLRTGGGDWMCYAALKFLNDGN